MTTTYATVGTSEFTSAMSRLLRAFPARARRGEADTTSLTALAEIQMEVNAQMAETVAALRSPEGGSYSWAEIGTALGISRQSAQQRFGSTI